MMVSLGDGYVLERHDRRILHRRRHGANERHAVEHAIANRGWMKRVGESAACMRAVTSTDRDGALESL
jgi:hypothetical protein